MKEGREEKFSSDLISDLYTNLLKEIWESVSALVGETTLTLLFNLAIRKIREKYPFLNSLIVSEEGLALEEVKKGCRNLPPAEIHRGFQSLINQLSHLFSVLTEGLFDGGRGTHRNGTTDPSGREEEVEKQAEGDGSRG